MGHIEAPLPTLWLGSYSVDWRIRHLMGHLGWGPTVHLLLKGAPLVVSYPVVQCVRSWWASLSIVQLSMLVCGEREDIVMVPPSTCDSAVLPCIYGSPTFLHRHFTPQSPLSHPLNLSLHSQQQPSPWDCSTISKFQLLAAAPSRGPASLFGVYMAGLSDSHSIEAYTDQLFHSQP